jgi:diacylglycerol kinase family enzyme
MAKRTVKPVVGDFNSAIVIRNPASTNSGRSARRIAELQRLFGAYQVAIVETNPDSQVFSDRLRRNLEASPDKILLAIAGGDGSVQLVINSLIRDHARQLDNIVILPLWGGNANDFAHMLNGSPSRKKLADIITKGRLVQVHPLQITIDSAGITSVHYAASYASFGASALAARELAKARPVKHAKLGSMPLIGIAREFFHIAVAFVHSPSFQVEMDGRQVEVFEQLFTNGSRLAKMDRLPLRLTDQQFYHALQSNKRRGIILNMLEVTTRRSFGSLTATSRSFTVKEPVLAQLDGEVLALAKDSKVTVGIAKQAVTTLSTKLH